MQNLLLWRRLMFAFTLIVGVVVLSISAWFKGSSHNLVFDSNFPWANFGIAIGVLTIIILVPLRIIELQRKNAFTSILAVELGYVSFLWILWLAEAGLAASAASTNLCLGVVFFETDDFGDICFVHWPSIVIAILGFFVFAMLFAWMIVLVVFAVKGNHWTSSVPDTDLGVPREKAPAPAPAAAAADAPTGKEGYGAEHQPNQVPYVPGYEAQSPLPPGAGAAYPPSPQGQGYGGQPAHYVQRTGTPGAIQV